MVFSLLPITVLVSPLTIVGERVGCLVLATSTEEVARNSQSVLESLQRSEISNPPAFGAKVAATILEDKSLRESWFEDLKTMSGRIQTMRQSLYDGLVANGMLLSSPLLLGRYALTRLI